MEQDQTGYKGSKIVQQLKEGSDDEEGVDSDTADEYNLELDDDIKTELSRRSIKEEVGLATIISSRRVSESVIVSLRWLQWMCGITPTTKRGQNIYMTCMLLIPLIPILALIAQNIILLNDVIIRKNYLIDVHESLQRSNGVVRLVASLQKERSETLFSLSVTNDIETQVKTKLDLKRRFLQTDSALKNVSNWRSPQGEEMF